MKATHSRVAGRGTQARFCAGGIALLALVLVGCDSTTSPGPIPAPNLQAYEAPPRDLIRVDSTSYNHLVRLDRAGGISKVERDRLAAFIADVGGNRPESLRVALRGAAAPGQIRSVADLLVASGVDPKHIVRADLRSGPIVVAVERAIAVLPDCPGWVDHVSAPNDNLPNPNFGCADVSNLALMVADPHHLREGASSIYSDGEAGAIGVANYRADKVKELPTLNEQFNLAPKAQ
jgi:pilus biogenesis lipoprotein CpaD